MIQQGGSKTNPLIKSPSDTTIYSPGLRRISQDDALINKISNFVESMRIESSCGRTSSDRSGEKCSQDQPLALAETPSGDHRNVENSKSGGGQSRSRDSSAGTSSPQQRHDTIEPPQPERIVNQLLVQAEKFKAKVEAPKGRFSELLLPYDYEQLRSKFVKPEGLAPLDSEILFLCSFDQDDEFFHVTSQIDPNLKIKIERGEFVELERLLPRDRNSGRGDDLNGQLFKLITQGTNSYLEPPMPKNSGKINSVKKWDQAFRVYAAIYTHVNPERASEIWQYVYVIHTAAAANPWDKVYYYDINFQELMASKPWPSWGKTYTQGWNMAFNNAAVSSYHYPSQNVNNSGNNSNSNNVKQRDWRDDCCWRFNKNRCKKPANECIYDHRCTYCAGWKHGFFKCRKRNNKFKKSFGSMNKSSSPKNSPRK